jgi:hypothetical protein
LQKIAPDDGFAGLFGATLALDGDTLVVGAPWHGHRDNQGALYIYERHADQWSYVTELQTADGDAVGQFGTFVDIDGDTIVASAPYHEWRATDGAVTRDGATYVFEKLARGWTETAEFGSAAGGIGGPVAVSGDSILAAGAKLHAYQRTSSGWQQTAEIAASLNEGFGGQAAMEGSMALFSSPTQDAPLVNSGVVYAYDKVGDGWEESQVLKPSDPVFRGMFGASVAMSGNVALIGRPGGLPAADGPPPGAAYLFERSDDGLWHETGKLEASDGFGGDFFGARVALSGDWAAVSALGWPDGRVYLFHHRDDVWNQVGRFHTGDAFPNDQFGVSLALDQGTLGIGARLDHQLGPDVGAAYLFHVPEGNSLALACAAAALTGRRRRRLMQVS